MLIDSAARQWSEGKSKTGQLGMRHKRQFGGNLSTLFFKIFLDFNIQDPGLFIVLYSCHVTIKIRV